MRPAVRTPDRAAAAEHSQLSDDSWHTLGMATATEHSALMDAATATEHSQLRGNIGSDGPGHRLYCFHASLAMRACPLSSATGATSAAIATEHGNAASSAAEKTHQDETSDAQDVMCMHVSPLTPDADDAASCSDSDVLEAVLERERQQQHISPAREGPSSAEVLTAVLAWEREREDAQRKELLKKQALLLVLTSSESGGFYEHADDYARLALASRIGLEPWVHEALGRMAHEFEECWEVVLDRHIVEFASLDDVDVTCDLFCESCGIRPGCEFLSYTECWECYSEHTD